MQNVFAEILKGGGHLQEVGSSSRIILKWTIVMWHENIDGIRVTQCEGQGTDICKYGYEKLGFVKGENC